MTGDAVLIPGTLCDARVFAPVRAHLPEMRAHTVELAGHARIEDVAQAALASAPPRFTGIGFSLGGFVVLEMLRRAPERFSGIALIGGNAHPDAPGNAAVRRAQVARAREMGMAAFVAENWSLWSAGDDPDACGLATEMACDAGHEAHARHAEMNIARADFRAVAAASPVPLLVLAGEHDTLCPRERYAAAASGRLGRLSVIPGAGHYLPLEAPGAVAAALSTWDVAA